MREEVEGLDAELTPLRRGEAGNRAGDPELWPRLEPLLLAAKSVRELASIQPSPAALARTRAAIWAAARNEPVPHSWSLPRLVLPRPALALAFAVLLMTLATTSVFASSAALPDSPLYSVRNLSEEVQLRWASTAGQRAALYVRFATARTDQLRDRARNHAPLLREPMQTLLGDITSRVREAEQEAGADGPTARALVREAEGQIEQELNQVQQAGDLPGAQGDSVVSTIKSLQSEEPGGQDGANSAPTEN